MTVNARTLFSLSEQQDTIRILVHAAGYYWMYNKIDWESRRGI